MADSDRSPVEYGALLAVEASEEGYNNVDWFAKNDLIVAESAANADTAAAIAKDTAAIRKAPVDVDVGDWVGSKEGKRRASTAEAEAVEIAEQLAANEFPIGLNKYAEVARLIVLRGSPRPLSDSTFPRIPSVALELAALT